MTIALTFCIEKSIEGFPSLEPSSEENLFLLKEARLIENAEKCDCQ